MVRLDPRWHQAAFRFIALGFGHILDGIDHLLFLLCLIVPIRRFWALVPIVTSFTVAHSITLIAAALGLAPNSLWFPPLIETLIALSIVYMAFENIIGAKLNSRWMIAFGFGLVHGFGFSFALSESLQFAGAHLLTSLVSFNIGVELGQLFVLAVTVPVLSILFRKWLPEVLGIVALSAFLAHTGWHWFLERGGALIQYDFVVPVMDAGFAATVLRWIMLGLIIGGAVWGLRALYDWAGRRSVRDVPEPVGKSARGEPVVSET
ncbi:MAG: HupE/UreJ family protein [Planctomycetota bacterium]